MADAPYPELKKTHTMAHTGRPWTDVKPPPAAPVWSVIGGLGSYYVLLAALHLDVFDTIRDIGPTKVAPLAERARTRLNKLGYDNVTVRTGDGNLGWPGVAPFDAIVVTAAGRVPAALIEQLKPGGRMVIPIDIAPGQQELVVIDKGEDGSIDRRSVLPVR